MGIRTRDESDSVRPANFVATLSNSFWRRANKGSIGAALYTGRLFPLIDELTNHLDLQGRQHVANYLQHKDGFIVVSHDRQFLNQVTDHTLAIEKSQLVLYQGNFSTYEEQKKLRDEFELAQNRKIKKEVGRLKKTAAEKAEWSRSRNR